MSKSVRCPICPPYKSQPEDKVVSLSICPHGNLVLAKVLEPKANGEIWPITIVAKTDGIKITTGTETVEADGVLVIALKMVDPEQQKIGATYEIALTDGFVTQVVPAAFFQTIEKVMGIIKNDLTTRMRPS